jgi:CDP-6-deoxy-D-xylo-4-hexulose-3-dehydrase
MRVPLASSGLRKSDIDAVMRVLDSGNLTMGKEVKNFESKMSKYLGVKHFVMVNSGSSANLLMIEALMRPAISKPKLNPGDSVLVPAIAWPTTIWPLIQLGLNPLFVDVDPKTLALDLLAAQRLIESSRIPVKGIFPIHPLGYAIPPSKLEEFVSKNELILINDVCESLGSWSEGKHAGTTGVATIIDQSVTIYGNPVHIIVTGDIENNRMEKTLNDILKDTPLTYLFHFFYEVMKHISRRVFHLIPLLSSIMIFI